MFCSKRYFIVCLLLFVSLGYSQEQPVKDSLYHKIEHFSKDKKLLKLLHRLVFRKTPDTGRRTIAEKHESGTIHQGKAIRNIYIETIDPLGNSSKEKIKNTKWYENLGNKLHIKSKNFTIRGYLLFREGEQVNPQQLYESERLLRSMRFINRAEISVIDSTSTQDSADIAVRILDSWSLRPMVTYSGSKIGGELTESNFLGLGHEISLEYQNDFRSRRQYRMASYSAQNIYGTFINAKISGEKDFYGNENVYMKANRNFVSPLTRWAGGIDLEYYKKNLQIPNDTDTKKNFPWTIIKVHHQDLWGGYQFRIKRTGTELISENIGVAARFQNFSYQDAPSRSIDPHHYFDSYNLFLASVGYSERKFKVERYVFRHNLPEDIPYGKNLTLTGGFGRLYKQTIPYAGISASYGFFNTWGYFNLKNEFGTFVRNGHNYRTTFRLDGTYFSPLMDWGKVNVRHFFSPTLVVGNLRSAAYVDRVHLSNRYEFPAYSDNYLGKDKLILRYQVQFFVKKAWKNFYYNPYFITAFGWLSKGNQNLFSSDLHTKFGIGVSIFNPYLSFNRFQISFVFYPKIPFDNKPVFDFNGYKNYHFPINNFAIDKPHIADYGNNFSD